MNKQKNIFESVQFIGGINEGVITGILSSIAFPIILVTITAIGCAISSKSERDRIQKSLAYALNNDKDLLPLKNKMKKGVRIISAKRLSERVKISDKDIDIINKNDISVMIIVDNNDKIIAYCLVEPNSRNIRYGYNIIDKSLPKSKAIDAFIRASFEFKIGIYGDGIKYFTKQSKNRNMYDPGKNALNDINSKANYLSKEESIKVYKELESFSNKLFETINKSFVPGIEIDDIWYYNNSFTITLFNQELSDAYDNYDMDDDDYDRYYKQDEEMVKKCDKALNIILNKLGFEAKNGYYVSDIDKYRFIKVGGVNSGEDIGNYSININCTKRLSF